LAKLAAQRREAPTDDLLGALVAVSEEGDRLTEDELIQLTLLLADLDNRMALSVVWSGTAIIAPPDSSTSKSCACPAPTTPHHTCQAAAA
jgi:hypothetical protein